MDKKEKIKKIVNKNNGILYSKDLEKYQKNNFYAEGIEHKDLIESLNKVGYILE